MLETDAPLGPVPRQERIAAIDILRGFALFGVFLVNMPLFVGPLDAFFQWRQNYLWLSEANRLTLFLLHVFAQGKFYTLFSFLFGAGFGLQLLRVRERDPEGFPRVFRRRLAVLLVIGLLHLFFVWWGDVLHLYALLGFALLLFRERPDKTLLIWVAALTLIPLALAIFGPALESLNPDARNRRIAEEKQTARERIVQDIRIYSSGSGLQILQHRAKQVGRHAGTSFFWGVELFASFLLGLVAVRRQILQHPENHRRLLGWLAFAALPLGLAVGSVDLLWQYRNPVGEPPFAMHALAMAREFLARPAMAYGLAAAVLLIGARQWLAPLAAVGRMALTNYLLQSVVFTTLAYSYGMALYGRIPPPRGVLYCVAFFAVQMLLSVLWLRFFPQGPAEWLWRRLTYGR
jgi:uncharacterized protein